MKTAFRRAAVLMAALVSVIALGAVPAQAVTVALSLRPGCDGLDYTLRVNYILHLGYPGGSRVVIRYWGDDPSSDDLLVGPKEFFLASFQDIGFLDICVDSETLNEDWGEDEIYAGVRVFDAVTGVQREVAETNRISGDF